MKRLLFLFLAGLFVLVSCKKSDDTIIPETEGQQGGPPLESTRSLADYPAQNFMWQTMNLYYFWQADVPDLADTKIDDIEAYVEFLSSEPDPADFFYSICNNHEVIVGEDAAIDRFSVAVENYRNLVNSLQGVSRSNGLEFQLYLFQDSNDIYGVVTYVALDSDASTKDIKRGDIFVGVNGQNLNLGNYLDLLFGNEDTYTLNMADLIDNTITDNGNEVTLTKIENFAENPILASRVIEQSGNKVGYLMYNSFLAAYDEQLNDVFGDFKNQGINELVLDLRYNGGGRVTSAIQIASSIYGARTDEVFIRPRFNSKLQPGNGQPNNFTATTLEGTAINELNLNRVFVITTGATASASELVINGLEPYVDVVQVGTTTVGKNEFSNTFVDDPENGNFYDPDRENRINPDNQWGIQPLLGRSENADGFSDYTAGLSPDFELEEDIANLGTLGDPSEPLLALALSRISSQSSKISLQPAFTAEVFSNSIWFKPTNNKALMDGLLEPRH
ncbi:S41 family peptidase [Ulvibacterium sp.]|uniref:S41 family peptidase n=1 Tax=Ulvibacterium sp. TaxID=2665914 RepID=UPI00261CD6B2|nr:S41 family peptidase [Ulvibacterium sp.]